MKRLFGIIATLWLAITCASAQDGKQIMGTFLSHDCDARVEIYTDGNLYQGRIVWSANDNKDVDKLVFRNLRYDSDRMEYAGKIFDTRFDKEYNVKIKVLPDGDLKVSPWWGPIKMNFTWARTASDA